MTTLSYKIIDAFPAFLEYWESVQNEPMTRQIDSWANIYMSPWPELRQKQLADYAAMNMDWRTVARQHVFPSLAQRLPAMKTAHANLHANCAPIFEQAKAILAVDCEAIFLFYVGIGCGAGWVTTYTEKPAVLFGLENIAEEGWSHVPLITGLIAHELGHVAHFHWRDQLGLAKGDDAWWQLYSEGVAQWCEHAIMGTDSWHMRKQNGQDDWLTWCRANKSWLAAEFLRRENTQEAVRDFFGSWYEIHGYTQSGYFLGYELIDVLITETDLPQIVSLVDYETPLRELLISWSKSSFANRVVPN